MDPILAEDGPGSAEQPCGTIPLVSTPLTTSDLPAYSDLILPTIRAVDELGGSATSQEITSRLLEDLAFSDEVMAVSFEGRPDESVLLSRVAWARSYAKLCGTLESPRRGVFLLTPLGKELLAMAVDKAQTRILDLDRAMRRARIQKRKIVPSDEAIVPPETEDDADGVEDLDSPESPAEDWRDIVLHRLHRLSPDGFEEFVLYVLRLYGLELDRVGGTGDEGIDGIGTAPISPVLSSRVAVQVKRYDPAGRSIGREVVALFQRDAQTKGAERAILVPLGKFSEPARKAANATTPTVDLIDGQKLTDLILEQKVGVCLAPRVNEAWFDRFN